ncbi:MAG: hypothetical protein WDM90_02960 [Ferruginibacter sp.]
MKKIFATLILLLFYGIVLSQDLKTTVDYLNDRIKDVVDGSIITYTDGTKYKFKYRGNLFGFSEEKKLAYYSKLLRDPNDNNGWAYLDYSFTFKPAQITEIKNEEDIAPASGIGYLEIYFEGKTAVRTFKDYKGIIYNKYEETIDYLDKIQIAYVKADPTAFERIKKAFLNLKKLAVDKDPFAN